MAQIPSVSQEHMQQIYDEQDQEISEYPTHNQELYKNEREQNREIYELHEVLKETYGSKAPDFSALLTWKQTYGRIYISMITSSDEIFVFRPIFRQEYREFVNVYGRAAEYERQAGLIEKCLLFPSPSEVLNTKPAGYLPSLETQIMFQSGFVSDDILLSSIKVIK